MKTTECRLCHQQIILLNAKNGKTVPVDPVGVWFAPDLNGADTFLAPDEGNAWYILHGVKTTEKDADRHFGYISHFFTCQRKLGKMRKKDRKAAGK